MRAAAANAESLDAGLDDVRVSVAAEVARNYFELRGLQQQLAVTERNLVNAQETLRLSRVRRDAGFGEEQDVASAQARVAGVQAFLPPLQRGDRRAANTAGGADGGAPRRAGRRPRRRGRTRRWPRRCRSAILARSCGGVPTSAPRSGGWPPPRHAKASPPPISFPRITVTGMLGLIAGRGNLFATSDSRAWAVTPALSWAAFDLGSARARLRGSEAASRETLAEYEQTVLRALEETANALVAYREQQRRLVSLADQARESGRAASIARVRYREGLSDFLALLDAERTELQAQEAVALAEAGVFTGVVSIYKSMGGIPR